MPPNKEAADDAALHAALRGALQEELASMAPNDGLADLHARLRADAAQAAHAAPVARLATAADWRSAVYGWFTRWPTALASLVIVLQAGLLVWQAATPPQPVTWRGTDPAALGSAATALVVVRFAPQATVADVASLLQQVQAEAVAGPDAEGRWTVAVPSTQREAAVASLRASALVHAAAAR